MTLSAQQQSNRSIWNSLKWPCTLCVIFYLYRLYFPYHLYTERVEWILSLTLFFPMFPFDPPDNIKKPKISYSLIRTRTYPYQGVRNVRFFDVFREIKMEPWEEKG